MFIPYHLRRPQVDVPPTYESIEYNSDNWISLHTVGTIRSQVDTSIGSSASTSSGAGSGRTGAIIGILVGIIVVLALCIGAAVWMWIIRNRRKRGNTVEGNTVYKTTPYAVSRNLHSRNTSHGSDTRTVFIKFVDTPASPGFNMPTTESTLELAALNIKNSSSPARHDFVFTDDATTVQLPSTCVSPMPPGRISPAPSECSTPSQWSLFPKTGRPYYTFNSRPTTSGSRLDTAESHRPPMPHSKSASEVSIKQFAPKLVQIAPPKPGYAKSEYASIHRSSRRTTLHQSVHLKDLPKDLPTLPAIAYTPPPPIRNEPRPMSFLAFLAQAQRKAQGQQPKLSSKDKTKTKSKADLRKSRRTSFKSFLGRNELGDEGVFVASDDPDAPFTMYKWPKSTNSSRTFTPRSSQSWLQL
jgi:hypothetical protein